MHSGTSLQALQTKNNPLLCHCPIFFQLLNERNSIVQRWKESCTKDRFALFPALTIMNPHRFEIKIDILYSEEQTLADSTPASVQKLNDKTIPTRKLINDELDLMTSSH
jgi:hypothetical protein